MSEETQASSSVPSHWLQESLRLIGDLVPFTSSVFCLVDPDMKTKGVVLNRIAAEIDKSYRNYYRNIDPAFLEILKNTTLSLICLRQLTPRKELKESTFYQSFLKPNNIDDAVDMVFRQDTKIIAILTLLRDSSQANFCAAEIDTLCITQRYLQYTINMFYSPPRFSQRKIIRDRYKLTERELDVLESIIAGRPNKLVAAELLISVATVKTHLHHIYSKLRVTSRMGLQAKVVSAIGN